MNGDSQNLPTAEGDAAPVNVLNRMAALPMVSSTISQVSNAYNWTKDKSSLAKYTLEVAESTVSMAASTAQPMVDRFEKPISAANSFANQQMDKLEEKVPMITDTPDKVMTDIQSGTKDRINNLLLTRLGKVMTTGVDTALLLSEFAVDYYLPQENACGCADGEGNVQRNAMATAGVEDDLPSDKPLEATVQRATRVTNKVRHRVVNRTMRNIRYAQKCSKETLDKLHYTVDLMEYARTNIDSANQAVKSRIDTTQETLWKTWDDWTLEEGQGDAEATKAEVDATNGEQKTLAIARSLAGRLRVLSSNVVGSVRVLPQSLRSRVEEGHELVTALCNSFEEAQTVRDLPANVLVTAKQQLNKLTDLSLSVADFLVASTPLTWLVPLQVRNYIAPSSVENGCNNEHNHTQPQNDIASQNNIASQ